MNVGALLRNPGPECGDVQTIKPESIQQGLERKKQRLEAQLKETNEALSALKSSPEVARVIDLVLATSRY